MIQTRTKCVINFSINRVLCLERGETIRNRSTLKWSSLQTHAHFKKNLGYYSNMNGFSVSSVSLCSILEPFWPNVASRECASLSRFSRFRSFTFVFRVELHVRGNCTDILEASMSKCWIMLRKLSRKRMSWNGLQWKDGFVKFEMSKCGGSAWCFINI